MPASNRKSQPLAWLLFLVVIALLVILEWRFPPRTVRGKARELARWAEIGLGLGGAAAATFLVRHYVVWGTASPPGSPAALQPPYGVVSASVAEKLKSLVICDDGGIRYRPC